MIKDFSKFLSIFADTNKRKILYFLMNKINAPANEITMHLDTSQPNASMHLAKLTHLKIITFQRDGVYKTFMLTRKGREYVELIQELEFSFYGIVGVEEFLVHEEEKESFDEPMMRGIKKRRF